MSTRLDDRVRVSGGIEVYRDSVELVPVTYPDDVETLERGGAGAVPKVATARDAGSSDAVLGGLIEVEGTATRFEEFSYSYEADLMGDQGDQVLVYIEKDTGIVPEFLDVGDRYRVTGISEKYDGAWQLKPRTEADFAKVYPKALLLDLTAQNSVPAGGVMTYTINAWNHTDDPLTNVAISATLPLASVDLLDAPGGTQVGEDGPLNWVLDEIPGEGGGAVVEATVLLRPGIADGSFEATASVRADGWRESQPVVATPWRTFVGGGVPIWAIQGDGNRSPFALANAATEGVVTGVFPNQGGFWIQSPAPDEDPATSEGLFVQVDLSESDVALAAGDYVVVEGKVRERSGQTLLSVASEDRVSVVTGTFSLPAPVALEPPRDQSEARAYFESLEGMLVTVADRALAVGPTSQYGETPVVLPESGLVPGPSSDSRRVRKGEETGALFFVDDGSSATHVDRATMLYAAKTGDYLADLMGPLAYTFENFKIQPVVTPTVLSETMVLPSLLPTEEDAFSIATFNVEDLFDVLDPHPSGSERPGIRVYRTHIEKLAATIVAMGAPTVIGLQEVENIGILEDVVEHELLASYAYEPVLIEGFDSRGIDVGYLVRGDVATVDGVSQHEAPEGLTSRPPLMITVTVQTGTGDRAVTILNNHFTSMSGGELPTEPRRMAQAAWNASLVAPILSGDPEAHAVVLGDLNSFYESPPLDVLRDAGLNHVYEAVGETRPYTYVYQGVSETLDHILVSPALYRRMSRVEALHVNADFPPPIPGDTSPERLSDHDPLVAVFSWDGP